MPALLIHFSAALLPRWCQPGRRTAQPLGFSFLFLRPVNFHKAFNVRTSRLISRVANSEPGTTAAIWLLRPGPRPQQPETLPDPSLNSPRCDLAEQIVWTLDGPCHNKTLSFLPVRRRWKPLGLAILPAEASGHVGQGKGIPSGHTHLASRTKVLTTSEVPTRPCHITSLFFLTVNGAGNPTVYINMQKME